MQKIKKYLYYYIFLAAAAVSLISCGKKSDKPTFTFIIPAGVTFSSYYKGITPEYLKKNPHIDIKLIEGDYMTFTRMLAAGLPVDLVYATYLPYELISSGRIKPLDSLIKNDPEYNIDDIYPSIIKETTHEGKTWCVSMGCSPVVLFYNKNLFEQRGVSFPDNTWNWDTLFQSALRLKSESCIPIIMDAGSWHRSPMYIWQNNAEVYDYKNQKYLFDSKEVIEAMEYQVRFYRSKLTPSEADKESSGASHSDLFKTGKVAMVPTSSYYLLNTLRNEKEFRYGIAPLPAGKTRANYLVSANLWMTEGTPHSEEVWKYIKFLMNDRNQYRFYTATYGLSSRKSVNKKIIRDLSERYPDMDFNPLVDSLENSRAAYFVNKGSKVSEHLMSAMDEIILLNKDIKPALQKLNRDLNSD